MSVRSVLLHTVAHLVFERPAQSLTSAHMQQRLTTGGDAVVAAMRHTSDTPAHQAIATHIIGIERWGQARLRDALTHTSTVEAYDHYRPASAPMAQLAALMHATRADTCALAVQLADPANNAAHTAQHNTFGALSIAGWLQYLHRHSIMESRKLGK